MAPSRPRPPKILVVCHGNTHRSPLAAAAMAAQGGVEVRSAGFRKAGVRAAKRVRLMAAFLGHDLEAHRSALVDAEMLGWADFVVYMDGGNRAKLLDAMRAHKITKPFACLGTFAVPRRPMIRDPAFMTDRAALAGLLCVIDIAARACARSVASGAPLLPWERLDGGEHGQ